ncbi:hypothetical protein R3X26_03400 [Vibrio sp. TH_r3]|uniref:hypothetical protein n=1 Tax=Vibrio sp. TH_r3 TaxID=3082084 RepID=UPI00295473B2|nr:hypothetical protein [Vibrio sp. TH_r3]MDV7103448.1 hypothetical protein [Vibrio sp. TH_r3]
MVGQKQFEALQTEVALLSPYQLQQLHDDIEAKLDDKKQPLINEEELDLIASLFR